MMSRTWKDEIQHSHKRHPNHPYWKYRRWMKHGDAETRRLHNRNRRAKAKQALHCGRDAPKEVRDLPWIWW